MSKADRRRRRLHAHREAALGPAGDCEPTPERLSRGDLRIEPVIEAEFPAGPPGDWTGARPEDQPRLKVAGLRRRDLEAALRSRLRRCGTLTAAQLAAAERLERDWSLARLEPRMIADLAAGGVGGGQSDPKQAALDARARVQAARQALRRGGEQVVKAVEGVVIFEALPDTLASGAYASKRDASIHARALVGVGLSLLADHYHCRG